MRTLGKGIPKECIDAFRSVINAPKQHLGHKVIVVDEVLPPELIKQIDARLDREDKENSLRSGSKNKAIAVG